MKAQDEVVRPNAQEVTPMVEIDGLSKWFGETQVLRDVTLNVGRGEKIVICGPSGSGKSTLLRCINGLDEPDRGYIRIDNIEVSPRHPDIDEPRPRIGMVFRQINLFPHLNLVDNLLLGPMCAEGAERPELEAKAASLLERVRLGEQMAKFPAQLSSGQQQRAAIARALMQDAKVLLFDAPTAILPAEEASEVLEVMTEIPSKDMTMLVVTHEIGFARAVADLIVYMDRGEIVEAASPAVFLDAPADDGTKRFVGQLLGH